MSTKQKVPGKQKAGATLRVVDTLPSPAPSAEWLALIERKKQSPAAEGKPRWVKHEDRPFPWPDGSTTTLRDMFPGLYPPADLHVQRAQVAAIPRGKVGWEQWPVPCPDPMCLAPHLGDTGFCTDPMSKQRHHYLCVFWDRTGRTPF